MKNISFSLVLLCIAALWSACDKPPIYNDTPTIKFVGFAKYDNCEGYICPTSLQDTIQQFTGTTVLVVDYTDGDGDIGSDTDTLSNMLIIDTRRNDTIGYRIPAVPQQGASEGISGEVYVAVGQVCCIDPNFFIVCSPIPDTYHEVVYKIVIRDNANRWSNEILTPPLKIRCY